MFRTGEVNLYKTSNDGGDSLKYYMVGDESNRYSKEFPIAQYNTVVTKETLTIRWLDAAIILTLNENTFAFYQKLFPLGNFPVSIIVHSMIFIFLVISAELSNSLRDRNYPAI